MLGLPHAMEVAFPAGSERLRRAIQELAVSRFGTERRYPRRAIEVAGSAVLITRAENQDLFWATLVRHRIYTADIYLGPLLDILGNMEDRDLADELGEELMEGILAQPPMPVLGRSVW